MNPNQALWEKGDFTRIAAFMRESGEEVAQSIGVNAGTRVLDLGCGDGTTALPMARLGAEVVGIDIAENLVDAGRKRAAEAQLDRLEFRQGDACSLTGVEDRSFDLTVSMFGAMFAPKPFDVAREMVRVTKPGGRVTMGNWIPDDPDSFVSQLLKIGSAYLPPPPEGFISPMTWGLEDHILERFARAGVSVEGISLAKGTYTFRSADKTPADFVVAMERFYGPTMNALEAAKQSQKGPEFHDRLIELAAAHNRSSNGGTAIPATYLRVTVQV
jgi:SAM-dependent methyltransferase